MTWRCCVPVVTGPFCRSGADVCSPCAYSRDGDRRSRRRRSRRRAASPTRVSSPPGHGRAVDGGGLFPTDTHRARRHRLRPVEPDYEVHPRRGRLRRGRPAAPGYDGFLTAAFGDIQNVLDRRVPRATYDAPWEPLSGGIFAAYPDRQEPIPGCGTDASTLRGRARPAPRSTASTATSWPTTTLDGLPDAGRPARQGSGGRRARPRVRPRHPGPCRRVGQHRAC